MHQLFFLTDLLCKSDSEYMNYLNKVKNVYDLLQDTYLLLTLLLFALLSESQTPKLTEIL